MDSYRGNLVQHGPADLDAHGAEAQAGTHSCGEPELAGEDDIARQPPPASVGQDERRMQVRAYSYWASLLGDRPFPQIDDLITAERPGFFDHAVVLDYSQAIENPAVTMLGEKLAEECGAATTVKRLSDVPERSLLARITDHCMQILTDEAPIGFEAEFVNQRGRTLLYRGILLPFSGKGNNIAHILGVINWKELADPVVTADLKRELEAAAGVHTPPSSLRLGAWADGPAAVEPDGPLPPLSEPVSWNLADRLAAAREAAEVAAGLEARSRAALYAAIGQAWDVALIAQARPADFRDRLAAAGLDAQAGPSMTAVVKLVFGAAYDKTRLADFAAALAYARRQGVGRGQLSGVLAQMPGGLKRVVGEERALRRAERAGKQQPY